MRHKENILPMIAAQSDVIERAGSMQAERAWHLAFEGFSLAVHSAAWS
jgi:hypothetical protein